LACPFSGVQVFSRIFNLAHSSRRNKSLLDAAIYIGTGFFQKVGSFLFLPLIISTLPPSELTRFGLFMSVIVLAPRLVSFNIHSASTRLLFDLDSTADRSSLLKTTLVAGVLSSVVISLALFFLANTVFGLRDPVTLGSAPLQLSLLVIVVMSIGVQFTMSVARIYSNAMLFSAVAVFEKCLPVAVFFALLAFMDTDYSLVLYAYCIGVSIVALSALYSVRERYSGGNLSPAFLSSALRFSFPTAINFLVIWVVSSSGRWIGAYYIPLEELAGYTLLTFILGGVSMIGRSLFDARLPAIGKSFASGELDRGRSIIFRTCRVSSVLVTLVYLAAFAFTAFISVPALDPYLPGLPLLLLAFVINLVDCVSLYSFQLMTALKRTDTLAFSNIIAGLTTVVLSLILVREYRASGLMLATTAGYMLQAAVTLYMANRGFSMQAQES